MGNTVKFHQEGEAGTKLNERKEKGAGFILPLKTQAFEKPVKLNNLQHTLKKWM